MDCWLQECCECGYVNSDLFDAIDDARRIVESDSYGALRFESPCPELARRFERYSLMQHADPESAAVALLSAAWVCEDAEDVERASKYRDQSAELLLKLQPCRDEEESTTLATALVDVLHRAERFDEARVLASSLLSFDTVKSNEIIASVLQFQCQLCDKHDTGCHTVADCAEAG